MLVMTTRKSIGDMQVAIETISPSIARGGEETVQDVVNSMTYEQEVTLGYCMGKVFENPNYTYQSTLNDTTYLGHLRVHVYSVIRGCSGKQRTVMKFLMEEAAKQRDSDDV